MRDITSLFLFTFLLFSSTSFAISPYKTKWFGGMDLALMDVDTQNTHSLNASAAGAFDIIFDKTSLKITDTSIAGGITLGFLKTFSPPFLWGIEGRVSLEHIKTTFKAITTEANSSLVKSSEIVVKLNNDLSIPFKIGMALGSNTLVYAIAGPEWAHFNPFAAGDYTQSLGGPVVMARTQKKLPRYKLGGLIGIGMEHLLTPRLGLGLEYNYSFYGKLSFPRTITGILDTGPFVTDTAFIDNNKVSAKMNQTMLKCIYYFS